MTGRTSEACSSTRDRWSPVAVTIGLLAVSNVVSNRIVTGWGYVPWNVAGAIVLVAVARRVDDLTWDDVGLSREHVRRGLRWAATLSAIVAVAYLVAIAVPDLRDLFRDRRVGDVTAARMLGEGLVRIPLGTVLLEEVAFRGVLLGQCRRRVGMTRGLALASVAFGLWHVLPAWRINTVNPVVENAGVGRTTAVIGAVVATTLAALPMGWARLRSRSLIAPIGLHVATNSLGYAVAWFVLRA